MFLRSVRSAILLGALAPSLLAAQRILGATDDAVTLPRGGFRFALAGESTLQRDRWRDGRLEGLGGNLTSDAFGALQFSILAPVEQIVRADLGLDDFSGSLGVSSLDARQRLFVLPLGVEYGLSERLTLGVRATLVRSRAESQWRIRGDSGRGNLGLNPIFAGSAVAGNNATIVGAYQAASVSLLARRALCESNPAAAPECPTLLAELPQVNALFNAVFRFSSGLGTLYGTSTLSAQRYVPLAGSAADSALQARADSLRLALERYGITNVTATTGLPLGAQLPVTAEELGRIVTDSTDGFGARPLDETAILALGDVHLSAKLRLFDSFGSSTGERFTAEGRGLRQSLLVDLRLGTSTRERPDAFLDLGTGTGRSALTVRSLTDVMANARLWATVSLGYTISTADELLLRVPSDTGREWLEWWREAPVPVTPGAELDVSIAPRWQLSDYLAVGALWQWRTKGADRHDLTTSTISPRGETVALMASLLDEATERSEQRFGVTATYSSLAARARGVPGLAFEISYVHEQSIASGSGVVPKQWQDRLLLRYYTRFLGR